VGGGGVPTPPSIGGPGGRTLHALIGAATAAYLVGIEDLEAAGAQVRVATDDGTAGARGFVTGLLEEALAGGTDGATVCACGPLPMLAAVARICVRADVSCQLALEAPMACGVGACLGCTVPRVAGGFARVCADGPVFDGRAIDWEALHE
jgi:dihydroorotate dehydrogenase electron transfer subunit